MEPTHIVPGDHDVAFFGTRDPGAREISRAVEIESRELQRPAHGLDNPVVVHRRIDHALAGDRPVVDEPAARDLAALHVDRAARGPAELRPAVVLDEEPPRDVQRSTEHLRACIHRSGVDRQRRTIGDRDLHCAAPVEVERTRLAQIEHRRAARDRDRPVHIDKTNQCVGTRRAEGERMPEHRRRVDGDLGVFVDHTGPPEPDERRDQSTLAVDIELAVRVHERRVDPRGLDLVRAAERDP